jgi:hypothetical protein
MLVCPGVIDAAGIHVANVNVQAGIVLKLYQLKSPMEISHINQYTDLAAIDSVALKARVALAFEFSDGVLEDALGVSVAREPVFIAGLCAPKILIITKNVQ